MNGVTCIDPREELSITPYVGAYIGPSAALDESVRHQMHTIMYKPRLFSERVVATHLEGDKDKFEEDLLRLDKPNYKP